VTSTKTRTTILTTLAAMGIATALPAVSQAKPNKPAKASVGHIHHSVRLAVTGTGGSPTTPLTTSSGRRTGLSNAIIAPVHVGVTMSANLKAGSAGLPGYTESACENLAGDYNHAVDEIEQGLISGDEDRTNTYGELANRMYGQLSDNCLVYW
jgi:hypothetical protein